MIVSITSALVVSRIVKMPTQNAPLNPAIHATTELSVGFIASRPEQGWVYRVYSDSGPSLW
jgi:hypothetical protein